jgi:hypothetical protein
VHALLLARKPRARNTIKQQCASSYVASVLLCVDVLLYYCCCCCCLQEGKKPKQRKEKAAGHSSSSDQGKQQQQQQQHAGSSLSKEAEGVSAGRPTMPGASSASHKASGLSAA